MQGQRYDDAQQARRGVVVARRRGGTLPPEQQAVQAAQSLAGNAAVSAALARQDRQAGEPAPVAATRERRSRHARTRGTAPLAGVSDRTGDEVELDQPAFDLTIAHGSFDAIAGRRRVRSSRGFAESLAGRRGSTTVDWRAGTGATLVEQPVRYAVGRRVATFSGRLKDFRGVKVHPPADAAVDHGRAVGTGVDLRDVPASASVRTGRARVRLGAVDLTNAHVPVRVTFDGQGSIRLEYRFRGGSLVLVGRERDGAAGAGLAWRYVLELRTRDLGEAVWLGLPRRRRLGGTPPPRPGADAHPPEPPRRGARSDADRDDPDLRRAATERAGPMTAQEERR